MKIVIFHFKLNNLLNWIKMTHFELNNILNWITKIIKNWIIFWIEFSWNDFESNIELNQFWAKFKHWIESIWVLNRARLHPVWSVRGNKWQSCPPKRQLTEQGNPPHIVPLYPIAHKLHTLLSTPIPTSPFHACYQITITSSHSSPSTVLKHYARQHFRLPICA